MIVFQTMQKICKHLSKFGSKQLNPFTPSLPRDKFCYGHKSNVLWVRVSFIQGDISYGQLLLDLEGFIFKNQLKTVFFNFIV